MKKIQVTTDVLQSREEVYDFLDVFANHEPFTDHVLTDWEYFGPPIGLGSGARVRAQVGGRSDDVSIEVVDALRPARITERNVGARGRRVATGTYELTELDGGGTRVAFTYEWERTPITERLAAPLVRRLLEREYRVAMERLAALLAGAGAARRLRMLS